MEMEVEARLAQYFWAPRQVETLKPHTCSPQRIFISLIFPDPRGRFTEMRFDWLGLLKPNFCWAESSVRWAWEQWKMYYEIWMCRTALGS